MRKAFVCVARWRDTAEGFFRHGAYRRAAQVHVTIQSIALQFRRQLASIALQSTSIVRQKRPTRRREQENMYTADMWLDEFLDALASDGISEVSLFRIEANGNHRRITSGPVHLFTEPYVQQTYG